MSTRLLTMVFVACWPGLSPADVRAPAPQGAVEEFENPSECLTEFWGRPVAIQSTVVLPPGYDPSRRYPICYSIHGFGGSHRGGLRRGPRLIESMNGDYPRLICVYLNAQFPMGHHEFADSANNGPWGRALTEEFIPAFERRYVPESRPEDRFLTGHSSGGWSSLWLQVAYPDFFNGTWSTAPDSVDFRDFTGIDVYEFENAYVDPGGEEIPLMRRNGEWAMSIRAFVERERERRPVGGQFYSFNAVFSPRGEDGTPMQLFDWETGAIDNRVAESWKKYDIVHVLDTNWTELAPRLRGKLHVYIGTLDTFRLEGACRLLDATLKRLGSDSEIILVEGRDHRSLFSPHKELWPRGMLERIHREMSNRFEGIREVDL